MYYRDYERRRSLLVIIYLLSQKLARKETPNRALARVHQRDIKLWTYPIRLDRHLTKDYAFTRNIALISLSTLPHPRLPGAWQGDGSNIVFKERRGNTALVLNQVSR